MTSHDIVDVCVVGLGYIGLPTASIFATKGLKVRGVDVVLDVVETINRGAIHTDEPDLDVMVRAAVQSGNLMADVEPCAADTFILAVPTPFLKDGDRRIPDLSYVENATRAIAPFVKAGNLVVMESTCPVGTTEKVRDWLAELVPVDGVHFAHCPERVLPGQMLKELVSNDRIAGGLTVDAAEKAKALYLIFCSGEIHLTDARTAELAKLTENASRDVGIAFANELSVICDELGIDVWELISLANRHPRVNILNPGPGVGGHCIAVDPWFIVDSVPDHSNLIQAARKVNDEKPLRVVEQVRAAARDFDFPCIACLGITFKANVDDLRESPALDIAKALAADEGSEILIVDPHVQKLPGDLLNCAKLVSIQEALERASVILLLVDHREFEQVSLADIRGKMVIDTRGMWSR